MLRMIKNQFTLRLDELYSFLAVETGGFVLGVIIIACLIKVDGTTDKTMELGTILAVAFAFGTMIFMGMAMFSINFNNTVSMGRTRKSFLPAYLLTTVSYFAIVSVIAVIFFFVERNLYPLIYTDVEFHSVFIEQLTPMVVLISIMGAVIIPVVVGTLIMKFGMKAFWILWAIWMIVCLFPSKIAAFVFDEKTAFFGGFGKKAVTVLGSVSVIEWQVIAILILLFGLLYSACVIRKQSVKL